MRIVFICTFISRRNNTTDLNAYAKFLHQRSIAKARWRVAERVAARVETRRATWLVAAQCYQHYPIGDSTGTGGPPRQGESIRTLLQ
jgi:hypothetical protein